MSYFSPLTDRHDAAPPAPEGATRVPLRVLLVEDCEDDVALILRLLRRGGYEPDWKQVQTAETLDAALAASRWDIVLSDYTMPQFDAMRALHRLREQSANLPFIVISGSIGEETAVAAMRAGASDYLMKSNLTRLVPAIERELRESADRLERTRTKKALQDLQEKFQVVFHEYLDVMLVLDYRNGHILHCNHTINRVMGYDERRLVGQPFLHHLVAGGHRGGRGNPRSRAYPGVGVSFGDLPLSGRHPVAHGFAGEQGAVGQRGCDHRHAARRERA